MAILAACVADEAELTPSVLRTLTAPQVIIEIYKKHVWPQVSRRGYPTLATAASDDLGIFPGSLRQASGP